MVTQAIRTAEMRQPANSAHALDSILPNERIRALLREVRGPNILHVGCVGHKVATTPREEAQSLHHQLCRLFGKTAVLGVDTDVAGIQRMKESGFEVEVGDAQNLRFSGCFDTIIAGELIEHLQNPGLFLSSAARGLKPGGTLVLSTPNVFSVMLNLMFWKNYDQAFNPEHAIWLCPQTLRELLRRYGFHVQKIDLVDDLEPSLVESRFYRAFAHTWMALRGMLPKRYRNTMTAVCTLA